jgi:hypothetical protein
MNKKVELEVKADFQYDPVGCYRKFNPYTICFVYPKLEDPYIVKGGLNDVKKWLKENQKTPAVAHINYFYRGKARNVFRTFGIRDNVKVFITGLKYPNENTVSYDDNFNMVINKNVKNTLRHEIIILSIEKTFVKRVRKIPRKWIKELDPYI